jgi:1-acyl-sn-glycerol-3-phosphate acyltransferase
MTNKDKTDTVGSPVDYLRFIAFFFAFILVTGSLFVWGLCAKVVLFWWPKERFERFMHRVACLWGKGILFFTPGWHVRIHNLDLLKDVKFPCVIVANHLSMADIWAIGCIDLQFRWFAKVELFRIPFVGWGMRNAGYISVDRNDPNDRKRSYERSVSVIRSGLGMLFFPEGTRSEDGKLRDFKVGAFKLAHETRVDVLPIIVKNTNKLIAKHSLLPRASTVHVKVLPIHRIAEDVNAEDTMVKVRNTMLAALESFTANEENL